MSPSSDPQSKRNRIASEDTFLEGAFAALQLAAQTAETESMPNPAGESPQADRAPSEQRIDREFIRRHIAPELELHWSRKYGRSLQ